MENNKAYIIQFNSTKELHEAMKFLFKNGKVFTTKRIKNFDEVTYAYSDFNEWLYIYICHLKECKNTFNTSYKNVKITCFNGCDPYVFVNYVSWDDFVGTILPNS